MAKFTFLSMLFLVLTGCTSGQVWVINQADNGGKIGYHGYLTGPDAKQAVASKIPCRPYDLNEDVEKTREAASESANSKVPDNSIDEWHEVSYTCAKSAPAAKTP